ncbi:MAG: stage III sporulation protein AG [Clostridiales bacterium]|nr:stage III sporulation protein AG [Clostridiales bacterium]
MDKDSGEKEGKKTFFDKLAENELYRKIIAVACIAGIALIFLSGFFKGGGQSAQPAASSQAAVTADQYARQIESSLTGIVGQIQGAGHTEVLVTLERNTEYVYATEEKTTNQNTEDKTDSETTKNEQNGSTEKKYILVKDADGSQKALPVTEVQPIIKGVVVVCDGGDSPAVQQDVISAVTTALDITSVRVCVLKAK